MSIIDQAIVEFDKALRTSSGTIGQTRRLSPASSIADSELSAIEKKKSAGLMRVNHCGEVCAQALYQGQALTAKTARVEKQLQAAADEETDHLSWCEGRIDELDSNVSALNPIWYASSFALGAIAGALGDKINLGFVAATEEQVCKHLEEHIEALPEADEKSRAVLLQMKEDELRHKQSALDAGGTDFPTPLKAVMTGVSNLMTKTSYWI
ncbi:MAG: 2-polyprenyl-3-methyl-6-methoxy-1,4-benzoquinone monooxygenase [Pseudomonadales bacterium]|jgi:ubiquinone biosynthesis monooxygenase Coq7|nr:2-polyprenyl-3-methyl-6-methoxy-1,4-benzoquinone monooxygenase [Pseudomonadales bacterium]MDG1444299.1 2-polyprenyl-3-methyl-6-methoxy-1,4-benzoquinone monooxygenase [Pseudomonadales bacterium]